VKRAAIVHYWLLNQRGGEKVLEALCRLLPQADIFTLFCDPRTLSPEVPTHKIATSFLNPGRRRCRGEMGRFRLPPSRIRKPRSRRAPEAY